MTLLGSAYYDPAVAVSKDTSAALALTALDTTNLRLTVTVPASGRVLVRLAGVVHGAVTYPQLLLGVLEGGAVKGRVAPKASIGGTALATTFMVVEGLLIVAGLNPGPHVLDAAYAVETGVASTNLKYGGPNDATGNNAFGAFVFEVWSA